MYTIELRQADDLRKLRIVGIEPGNFPGLFVLSRTFIDELLGDGLGR